MKIQIMSRKKKNQVCNDCGKRFTEIIAVQQHSRDVHMLASERKNRSNQKEISKITNRYKKLNPQQLKFVQIKPEQEPSLSSTKEHEEKMRQQKEKRELHRDTFSRGM